MSTTGAKKSAPRHFLSHFSGFAYRDQAVGLLVAWLLIANLSHLFLNNPLGWFIILAFFLLVPGYLLLRLLGGTGQGELWALSLSFGLSIFLLMLGGLLLNMATVAGVRRPLSAVNIFILLDTLSFVLIAFCRKSLRNTKLPVFPIPKAGQLTAIVLSLIMPVLATLGAISLNNNGSNALTLLLFFLIAIVFVLVAASAKLIRLAPYVLFCMALAVLLSTSLRGWYITGHDVQTEFLVFQLTAQNAHWSISAFRNAYNACLSITILPTMILRLTSMPSVYVFKIVFQFIYAFSLIPLYLFMKRMSDHKVAFLGSFIFISLPAFLNDMPMINRQEVGMLFFILLMLVGFARAESLANRSKKTLIILLLIGIVFAHYSTMYITLALLSVGGVIYWILGKINKKSYGGHLWLIGPRLLGIAFLLTFCWNLQLTNTANGLSSAVSSTLQNLFDHSGSQSDSVSYSLLAQHTQSPAELLANYSNHTASQIQYAGQPNIPITKLGSTMGHLVSPQTLNNLLRGFSAKILQILLLMGTVVLIARNRKGNPRQSDAYFLSLCLGCVVLLVLQTLLPQLSVDYGLLRFLQQLTIILGIPMVLGLQLLIKWPSKKTIIAALFLSLLFLDLTGFMPEILGDYPPQLALNNSGIYYEAYYVHKAELLSSSWLLGNKEPHTPIEMDKYARLRFIGTILLNNLDVAPITTVTSGDYAYQDNANVSTNTYQIGIDSIPIRYTLTQDINSQKNLIYNNGESKVYR